MVSRRATSRCFRVTALYPYSPFPAPLPEPEECLACFWLRQISEHREHEVLCIAHLDELVVRRRTAKAQLVNYWIDHRGPLAQVATCLIGMVAVAICTFAVIAITAAGLHWTGVPR